MLRVAIVDDEPLARARLTRMLKAAGVDVVAEGENGAQAVELVNKMELDALVIDINMPLMNGMDAVKKIAQMKSTPPAIIFCTAHDEYAVQAFRTEAIDYLLKPFSNEDLLNALGRVERYQAQLKQAELSDAASKGDIVLHYQGKLQKIRLSEIIYFFSHEKSVFAVMKNGDQVYVDQALKHLEQHYQDVFIRAHRAYLVQTDQIKGLRRSADGASLSLRSSEQEIPVSRRHLKFIKACFKD